jgi:protein-S-isoprenylcysteine O-methyltransferase Ste14
MKPELIMCSRNFRSSWIFPFLILAVTYAQVYPSAAYAVRRHESLPFLIPTVVGTCLVSVFLALYVWVSSRTTVEVDELGLTLR